MKAKNKFTVILTSFSVAPLVLFCSIISLLSTNNTVPLSQVIKIFFTMTCVLVVFSIISSIIIYRKLIDSVEKVTNSTKELSEDDFFGIISSNEGDETSNTSQKLSHSMSKVKNSLSLVKTVSEELRNSAVTLTSTSQEMMASANEVSHAINEIAEGSNSQANEIVDVVNLLTNLASEINLVQQKLYEVNENTVDTETKAVEGENKIYDLINFIVKIKQSFDIVMDKINGLSTTVSEIGKITDIINSISEQTNLLALNASIEAARAGEHGRGFTVVASEVRKLAEESKESSEKIINLVKSITLETGEVIENSAKVGSLLEDQATVANDTIISFEDIIDSVKNVPQLIKETEKSLNIVVDNNRIVLDKVQNISEVAQEVSTASEEISASSQGLLESSEEVSNLSLKINDHSDELSKKIDIFKF